MSQVKTNNEISPNEIKTEKFAVKPAFLQLLKTVGANGNLFTLSQVLGYMKNYIISHNLYDKTNPRQIFCENDELGKVLGVNKFTIDDVMNLLTLVLYRLPVTKDCIDSSNSSSVDGMKRLLAEENVESKKLRLEEQSQAVPRPISPIVICIPEKPDYDSDCETDLSIQSYETALAKDSTDDLWFLEEEEEYDAELGNDSEDYFSVEYEVGSASSLADNLVSDTDSDIEDIVNAVLICKDDSDMEFWADSSDSDDDDESTDPELAEGDKWICSRCKSLNRPPMRYCQKCWDQRIGWLPENRRHPPRRRNRKRCKKNKRSKLGGKIAESKLEKEMSNSIEENATEEGHLSSTEERKSNDFYTACSSTKNTEEKTFNNMERKVVDEHFNNTKEKTCDYFCMASTSYSSRERTVLENENISISDKSCDDSLKNVAVVSRDNSAKSKRTSSDEICSNSFLSSHVIDKEANMCPLCLQREKTGIIVHGRTGHQMCCYSCARHLENQKKPCPICRRTIQRVIRNFCV